jgi:hypothetical protein
MSECPHCKNGFFDGNRYGQDVECVNGVLIDIDVFNDGFQHDVVYPVAPCHPCWELQKSDPDAESWDNDSQQRLAAAVAQGDTAGPDITRSEDVHTLTLSALQEPKE